MKEVIVIDYGLGNMGSIVNMVKKCGGNATITSDKEKIAAADRIILPGVGAFDSGMERIHNLGLKELLWQKALKERIPFLGICLGMQLMTIGSEEGRTPGLSLIDAKCIRFPADGALRIPHMGWNVVRQAKSSFFYNITDKDTRFYFVHSYKVICNQNEDILLTSDYGETFCAAFERDNIFGVQFHPEKSHRFGKELIGRFLDL
jgi:glutamine amidotransferase